MEARQQRGLGGPEFLPRGGGRVLVWCAGKESSFPSSDLEEPGPESCSSSCCHRHGGEAGVSEGQVGLVWGCLSFSCGQWMCAEIPLPSEGFLLLRRWGYLSVFGLQLGLSRSWMPVKRLDWECDCKAI